LAITNRLRSLIITAVTIVTVALAAAPAYAAAPKVHVRVEDGNGTVAWSTVTPFTGTVQGHPLKTPTPLGALITATTNASVPLGLQWFDPYGFFINSIDGRAGTPTKGWAFKIGQTLSAVGADAVTATSKAKYLFYYTTYDPVTFATQPTLGISDNASKVKKGSKLTVKVRSYDDAGKATLQSGAQIYVGGVKAGVTGAKGTARVTLTTKGRFQVRAAFPGAIRSTRLWVRVT
jgi:hypothetical protein